MCRRMHRWARPRDVRPLYLLLPCRPPSSAQFLYDSCVLTSATIQSAPPVMFFPQIFPKMVSTQLFASERKACEVIDEVSRSSFTPEVHTSTLFCVAAPPLSRRAHLRGEQGAVMSTCMRVRGVCYRIWGGGYQDTYPDVSCMYPDVS